MQLAPAATAVRRRVRAARRARVEAAAASERAATAEAPRAAELRAKERRAATQAPRTRAEPQATVATVPAREPVTERAARERRAAPAPAVVRRARCTATFASATTSAAREFSTR